MILEVLARATALGLLVLASSPVSCSSHVDVGFTSDGGAQSISDAGDASRSSRSNTSGDAPDARGPACTFVRSCVNGVCELRQVYADWCTEVCRNSIDVCDGQCVDLSSDPKNCGWCFHDCSSFEKCVSGDCR
jgi:hypothetical protein